MRKLAIRNARSRRGMTLVEVVTALAISTVASMAMISVFVLATRFTAQGFTESRLLSTASLAIEKATRQLNHAYRNDAVTAADRYVISDDKREIEFSIPVAGGGTTRLRYRYDDDDRELEFEQRDGGGAFASVADGPMLRNVEDFFVENQEGILSIVLSVRSDMGGNGDKRFTLVGRALPRNL